MLFIKNIVKGLRDSGIRVFIQLLMVKVLIQSVYGRISNVNTSEETYDAFGLGIITAPVAPNTEIVQAHELLHELPVLLDPYEDISTDSDEISMSSEEEKFYSINCSLYRLERDYCGSTVIEKFFTRVQRGLNNDGEDTDKESLVLIKSLIKNTPEAPSAMPVMPLKIRRADFSYKFPIVNFSMASRRKIVKVLLVQHDSCKEKKVTQDLKKMAVDAYKNGINIPSMANLIWSIITQMVYCIYSKDMPQGRAENIIQGLKKTKKPYTILPHLNSPVSYMFSFRIGYEKKLLSLINDLEEIFAKEGNAIEQHNEKIMRSSRKKRKNCIPKNQKRRIKNLNSEILTYLKEVLSKYLVSTERIIFSIRRKNIEVLERIISSVLLPSNNCKRRTDLLIVGREILEEIFEKSIKFLCIYRKITKRTGSPMKKRIESARIKIAKDITNKIEEFVKRGEIKYERSLFEDKLAKGIEAIICIEVEIERLCFEIFLDCQNKEAIEIIKNEDIRGILKTLKEFNNGFFADLVTNIKTITRLDRENNLVIKKDEITWEIFDAIYTGSAVYLNNLAYIIERMKDSNYFFENPAFLHYIYPSPLLSLENISEESAEPRTYVIFKKEDGRLYKKNIVNNELNLKNFATARTALDIENLEGEQSIRISMCYLFELEDEEMSIL